MIDSFKNTSFKKSVFIILILLVFGAITIAYSNHFSNGFHFDDSHTIENNNAIKEVNVLSFFTDGSTFSALPSNQSYRPLTTLENAIDYKLAGGLNPKMFHIHIFIIFLITCLLIGVFVKKLLDKLEYSNYNQFWGLLVAAVFGLLCANAETVNYIIQRAEIVSGMFVLLGFVAFLKGGVMKNKYIYLLFPLIGFFSKEMALVFAPLLLLYFLIFEENVDLLHFYRADEFKKCWRSFVKVIPSIILTAGFLVFYSKMLPETFSSGGLDRYAYLITQPMVMVHYFVTFFYPYNLSADSDWVAYSSILDYRAIIGIVVIVALIFLALKASKNKKTKLFSFGILWFFISLLPTSSFIPFAEVLNDHRSFIPYIGLAIAFIFGMKFLFETYLPKMVKQKSGQAIIIMMTIIFLSANAYGVHERNKVWKDDLSLWHDVSIKSPKNGRGLMNYGLALMAKADYINAEIYLNKAIELSPNYSYIYVNLGVLKNAIGDKIEAENNFRKGILCDNLNHTSWYYFGKFLIDENRFEEAKVCLIKVLEISPNYSNTNELLMSAYHNTNDWEMLTHLANSILASSPNDISAKKYLDIAINKKSIYALMEEEIAMDPTAEKYLNLSLTYFNHSKFEECINAAQQALKLKSNFPEAYNNIGIAYFNLRKYDKAIEAYQYALDLNPTYALVQNNLKNAISKINNSDTTAILTSDIEAANNFINLSLTYYNEGKYLECIEASKKAIAIIPSANAYNNICTAYNQLKQYKKAIEACNEALKLDRNHTLAKGNLNYALQQ